MLPLDDDGEAFTRQDNCLRDWGDDMVRAVSWMMWAVPAPQMLFLMEHIQEED